MLRWRMGRILVGVVMMVLVVGACDGGGPGPTQEPIGPFLPTPAPTVTPISPGTSQTIEGIKVSVQLVSFDAHRVELAYSLEGRRLPNKYWLRVNSPEDNPGRMTINGKELDWIYGADANPAAIVSEYPPTDGESFRAQGILTFDASKMEVKGATQSYFAYVSLPVRIGYDFYDRVSEPVPTGVILPSPTPTEVHPASKMVLFSLSFPVTFDPRHIVVQVGQTVESNGVKMTLERVDATASEMRMSVSYVGKVGASDGLWDEIYGTLEGGSSVGKEGLLSGEPSGGDEGACYWDVGKGRCVFSYAGPELMGDAPVTYTLTVNPELSGAHTYLGGEQPPRLGTWVFRFTVPAATGK